MYTPERRNNRNLECPNAPQRPQPQNRYNFGNNIPLFPNLDLVENDIHTTPLQLHLRNIPNTPQKSNSKIDDDNKYKAYACKRRLSFNK
tara:strand:+ start:79 stop:345 length:267 start_codon:yes stop_codon:yes gene_type:complete